MRKNETSLNMREIQNGFEQMGLGHIGSTLYPGATIFSKQYKRCSVLREVPTTYSNSSTVKINE